ncbi:DUF6655 family protein [Victivallis sp. Marseille-Q1083]|uniref:DUF6655 family protein n=1 Tax=Victivallis sp. Marseille-Q1083 TaxID=2717288 RepID=UPI001588F58F|nr:DUF6655 family protein [Victivallis sp. Marseille-Q1083]
MPKFWKIPLVLILLTAAGCSSPWVTNTSRSAVEQQLISAVVERGMEKSKFRQYAGKKVFLDYGYLEPQTDKAYLQGYLELRLAEDGLIVTRQTEDAELIIQPTSGVLATDQKKILLGTPSLPIPVPYTDLTFAIPEIPLFLRQTRYAFGRFSFNILTPDRHPLEVIRGVNSRAHYTNWVILLIPFVSHDLPLEVKGEPEEEYSWNF